MTAAKTTTSPAVLTLESALTGLSVLAKQISAFGDAIEAAAKAEFGNIGLDAVAAADAAVVATQVLEDFGVPGTAEALTIEQLIALLAPEAVPAIEWVIGSLGVLHGATPDEIPHAGAGEHGRTEEP